MSFSLSINKLRSVAAVALTLWCAGAGCMLVSYARGAAMSAMAELANDAAAADSADASASMGGHACCKARHASAKREGAAASRQTPSQAASTVLDLEHIGSPSTPSPSGAMSCCPLTSGSFVVTTRSHSADDDATGSAADETSTLTRTDSPGDLRDYPPRLPNQNQTYLRCCVFLI